MYCTSFPLVAEVGATLPCDVWASQCCGFSESMDSRHAGLVVGVGSFKCVDSAVTAHRPSCSMAWGIFLDQDRTPALAGRFLFSETLKDSYAHVPLKRICTAHRASKYLHGYESLAHNIGYCGQISHSVSLNDFNLVSSGIRVFP